MEIVLWLALGVVAGLYVLFAWDLKRTSDEVERQWPELKRRYEQALEQERKLDRGRH